MDEQLLEAIRKSFDRSFVVTFVFRQVIQKCFLVSVLFREFFCCILYFTGLPEFVSDFTDAFVFLVIRLGDVSPDGFLIVALQDMSSDLMCDRSRRSEPLLSELVRELAIHLLYYSFSPAF